jgi:hypothetical protein
MSAGSMTAVTPGITVSVDGTSLSSPVDSKGKFELKGVPGGDVELKFKGPSLDAKLRLAGVQPTETITLSLTVEAGTVQVEGQRRSTGREEQLEGRIDALPASPALSLVVAGRAVLTDANTKFFLGEAPATFAQLAVGQRVHVKGQTAPPAALLASVIMIQNTNIDVPDDDDDDEDQTQSASIEAALASKSGVAPDLTLVVGTTTVRTSAATEVRRKGDVQEVSVLAVGMTLHVVGTRRADASIDARMIQIKDDAVGGPVEISGSAGGVKGTCPALTFKVNGYDVATDILTAFTPSCLEIKSGTKVTVRGVIQADGSVKATSVAKQ